jgi:anti-sigma28 factor (negative regulator of flagellin synthesis)
MIGSASGGGVINDMKVIEIQEQIGRGAYQVDAQAVADAIVRRLQQQRVLPVVGQIDQSECS